MEQYGKDDRLHLLTVIVLCFITAVLSFNIALFRDGGLFTLTDDFNAQQIPFTIALHNQIINKGIDSWMWSYGLGTSTVQGMSFYQLGSPFFWLSMLFPARAFGYLVGWFYVLKYVIAGIGAYLYIGLFVKDRKYAVLGAVLYAFSGFQAVNLLFYHFHDVVAFFPFLLHSMERFLSKKKYGAPYFAFMIFLSCMTNYVFFVMECIFLVIYFLIRFWVFDVKKMLTNILKCLGCGALGVGMASWIFIPSIYYVMGNPRTQDREIPGLFWNYVKNLFILKGMIMPGEAMNNISSVVHQYWKSTSCYLPLFGMLFVIAYIRKNRDWLTRILVVVIICSFSPALTSAFLLFSDTNQRWWFVLTLLGALATVRVLEEIREYKIHVDALIYGCLLSMWLIAGLAYRTKSGKNVIFMREYFLLYVGIMIAGFAISCFGGRISINGLIVGAVIFSVITTYSVVNNYYENYSDRRDGYIANYNGISHVALPDDQYRILAGDNVYTLLGNINGTGIFSSTIDNALVEFQGLFDYSSANFTMDINSVEGLPELVGAKYRLNGSYENEIGEANACPIGYAVDTFVEEDDVFEVPVENRGRLLLNAVVIDSEEELGTLAERMMLTDAEKAVAEKSIDECVELANQRAVKNFEITQKGFNCSSDYDKDTMVYFTVPNNKGWSAYVDGVNTQILNSGGMMLLPVDKGQHNIVFEYHTPLLNAGKLISLVSMIIYAGWGIIYGRPKDCQLYHCSDIMIVR